MLGIIPPRRMAPSKVKKRKGMNVTLWILGVTAVLVLVGCGTDSEGESGVAGDADSTALESGKAPTDAPKTRVERALAKIDELTDRGDVDRAAGELIKMRMKGTRFSADEAAAYRDSLAYVYDRAIELVDEGNPKANAALKKLQSTGTF